MDFRTGEFPLSEVSSCMLDQSGAIKVNVLAWKIKLDNLPTRLNISHRGMDIDSILCPTCGKAVESTRHIFFTCQIARDILHLITSWWNIPYMKVSSYEEWLSLDRLPHRLNLSSRGMDISAISCPSCNANVESANHVFFECDIATDMWKLVFKWCDIPLFQASSWDSFNDWIISWHASKEKKHRFYIITTSVLWWLWRYRNSVTFNSQPLRKSDLFDNVRFSSFSWLHNRDHMKLSWNDWLICLNETVGNIRTEYEPTTAERKAGKKNEMKARGNAVDGPAKQVPTKFHSYQDSNLLMKP
ncbi:RNA-directed DNA polymerase, eukaryota [Tanacetum coccineum]